MYISTRRAVLPILALVIFLAGCASSSTSLSLEELQGIRIERVDVVYKPDAIIHWEKVEVPYIDRVKAAKTTSAKAKPWKQEMLEDKQAAEKEYETLASTPEAKRYMQGVLAAELKARLGAAILPKYQGTRPVVLELHVSSLIIPGPTERVLLGGSPSLKAVTVLKDSATGKELAKLDQMAAVEVGNGVVGVLVDQAFADLEDRVFGAYINNVSAWLQAKREG